MKTIKPRCIQDRRWLVAATNSTFTGWNNSGDTMRQEKRLKKESCVSVESEHQQLALLFWNKYMYKRTQVQNWKFERSFQNSVRNFNEILNYTAYWIFKCSNCTVCFQNVWQLWVQLIRSMGNIISLFTYLPLVDCLCNYVQSCRQTKFIATFFFVFFFFF